MVFEVFDLCRTGRIDVVGIRTHSAIDASPCLAPAVPGLVVSSRHRRPRPRPRDDVLVDALVIPQSVWLTTCFRRIDDTVLSAPRMSEYGSRFAPASVCSIES